MNRFRTFFIICAALTPVTFAQAAEIEAEGPIDAVTVYADRAQVTRTLRVELAVGEHTVILAGLPGNILIDTVRVGPVTGAGVTIGSVELVREIAAEAVVEAERKLLAELQALQDRRRGHDDAIETARLQLNFVTELSHSFPQSEKRKAAEGIVSPGAWAEAIGVLGAGAGTARQSIREAEIERRELDKEIAAVQRRLASVRTGRKTTYDAHIALGASAAGTAGIRLSYQVPGATWRPTYEARLDTQSGALRLIQSAEVRQRSGEEWDDIALTLSTSAPARGVNMPELAPWFIDFARPFGGRRELQKVSSGLASAPGEMKEEDAFADDENEYRARERGAAVIATEFSAEYRIAGRVSIAADQRPRKFLIGERGLEPELSVRAVPKIAPVAYLYGKITLAGEEPLLPGSVAIYRDGSFIGNGALGLLRPGEESELSFGVDDRVAIEYRFDGGEQSSAGLLSRSQRIERHYTIEVANFHDSEMVIEVLGQLPVSRNEDIEVELLDFTTEPTEQDLEDRPGIILWRHTFDAGEERVIRFGYAVIYPEGQVIPGF